MEGELVWQNPEYNTCTYPYDAVEENKDSEITHYPNPGKDVLNISTALQNSCVELYDINVKLISKQEISDVVTSISTENLPSGIYVWKVRSLDKLGMTAESGKWVKE